MLEEINKPATTQDIMQIALECGVTMTGVDELGRPVYVGPRDLREYRIKNGTDIVKESQEDIPEL